MDAIVREQAQGKQAQKRGIFRVQLAVVHNQYY